MSYEAQVVVFLTIGVIGSKLYHSADGGPLPPSYGPPRGPKACLGMFMMLIGFVMWFTALASAFGGFRRGPGGTPPRR